jgi:hypothetical protein
VCVCVHVSKLDVEAGNLAFSSAVVLVRLESLAIKALLKRITLT